MTEPDSQSQVRLHLPAVLAVVLELVGLIVMRYPLVGRQWRQLPVAVRVVVILLGRSDHADNTGNGYVVGGNACHLRKAECIGIEARPGTCNSAISQQLIGYAGMGIERRVRRTVVEDQPVVGTKLKCVLALDPGEIVADVVSWHRNNRRSKAGRCEC